MKTKLFKYAVGSIFLICTLTICFFTLNNSVTVFPVVPLDLSLTNDEGYILEASFETTMQRVVEPYLTHRVTKGYFNGKNDAPIYYEYYKLPTSKASIVISHGFTESSEKFKEVIYYFLKHNYSVYILDHRGHGLSYRMVSDFSLVHIDDFDDYVDDFYCFITKIVVPQTSNEQLFLYAHSMGGAIGILFLERYPHYFDAAILSSPMLEVKLGSLPHFIASATSTIATTFGKGEDYMPLQYPFDPIYNLENSFTNCAVRYTYYFNKRISHDYLQNSGCSFGWMKTALAATSELMEKNNIAKVTIPILIFQAQHDSLVSPNSHYQFAKNTPHSSIIFVPGAKHELYNAENKLLVPYFNTLFNFLEQYINKV